MPTYEYECSRGHQFEVVQSMTDPPLKRCRVCRAKARRLISATGFILKGGGWYADGYSSSGNNGRNGDSDSAREKASSDTSKKEEKASPAKSS
jgi:putative FmdB family regulatory protein